MHRSNQPNLLDVLDELVQLPREQRRARMDELDGLSGEDRATLGTWLEHHESSVGFLDSAPPLAREGMRLLLGADDAESSDAAVEICLPPQVAGYAVLNKLGQGGMATVWRATQLSTGRDVALKVMDPLLFASARARNRFEREVRLTA